MTFLIFFEAIGIPGYLKLNVFSTKLTQTTNLERNIIRFQKKILMITGTIWDLSLSTNARRGTTLGQIFVDPVSPKKVLLKSHVCSLPLVSTILTYLYLYTFKPLLELRYGLFGLNVPMVIDKLNEAIIAFHKYRVIYDFLIRCWAVKYHRSLHMFPFRFRLFKNQWVFVKVWFQKKMIST